MSHITIIISHDSPVSSEVKWSPDDAMSNEEIGEHVCKLIDGLDALDEAIEETD